MKCIKCNSRNVNLDLASRHFFHCENCKFNFYSIMIPNQIVIHHTASLTTYTLDQMNADHKAKFGLISSLGGYIAYHYVIEANGKITQTRRDNEIGCHCPPNEGRIGICLVGNFQLIKPTPEQIVSLSKVVESLQKTYNINEVWGHRDCRKTECPGDNLYMYVQLFAKINWLERQIKLLLMPKSNA